MRVSMGLSFHDENSMVEAAAQSLCFVSPNDSNPVPGTGIVQDQEDIDEDFGDEFFYDSDSRDGSRDMNV